MQYNLYTHSKTRMDVCLSHHSLQFLLHILYCTGLLFQFFISLYQDVSIHVVVVSIQVLVLAEVRFNSSMPKTSSSACHAQFSKAISATSCSAWQPREIIPSIPELPWKTGYLPQLKKISSWASPSYILTMLKCPPPPPPSSLPHEENALLILSNWYSCLCNTGMHKTKNKQKTPH